MYKKKLDGKTFKEWGQECLDVHLEMIALDRRVHGLNPKDIDVALLVTLSMKLDSVGQRYIDAKQHVAKMFDGASDEERSEVGDIILPVIFTELLGKPIDVQEAERLLSSTKELSEIFELIKGVAQSGPPMDVGLGGILQ